MRYLSTSKGKTAISVNYGTINGNCPEYLSKLSTKCSVTNPCKSHFRENDLNVDINNIPKQNATSDHLSYTGAKLRNSLPYRMRHSNSKMTFKN